MVRLKEVVVASATSVKVLWDVLDPDQVEGLSVYWLAEPGNRTEGATEASPAGPGDEAALQSLVVQTQPAASSPLGLGLGLGFLVTGLRCFTAYNFFLVPFNQHGEGRPSNSFRARTLAARKCVAGGLHGLCSLRLCGLRLTTPDPSPRSPLGAADTN